MNSFFKIFGWLFGILSLVSAVLQYNDPDPLIWVSIYVIIAAISFAFALGRINTIVPLLAGVIAVVGCWYTFPEQFEGFTIGEGDIKNIEEGRESIGLLIVAVVMFVFAFWTRFSKSTSKV